MLSCRNGHHEVVEYLVDRCCASVEQAGSVTFDGETIEGAPPLWCAAAAGNLPVLYICKKKMAEPPMQVFTMKEITGKKSSV